MNNNKRLKDTKGLVRDIFFEHPDWNARQIYDRYLILIGDAEKRVTLNAIQKHLEDLKPVYRQIQEKRIDIPWHMGSLKAHPLLPEAIPYIFKVNEWGESQKPPKPKVSIRQAYWLAHYYPLLAKEVRKLDKKDLQHLWTASHLYSYFELMSEFAEDSEFDSSPIDDALWNGGVGYLLAEVISKFPDYAKKANTILSQKDGNK